WTSVSFARAPDTEYSSPHWSLAEPNEARGAKIEHTDFASIEDVWRGEKDGASRCGGRRLVAPWLRVFPTHALLLRQQLARTRGTVTRRRHEEPTSDLGAPLSGSTTSPPTPASGSSATEVTPPHRLPIRAAWSSPATSFPDPRLPELAGALAGARRPHRPSRREGRGGGGHSR
uniref:Uncharacterized protein n=1 Tax=Oryza punctata TaxID=4537 RepID=A0A0E0JFU3_ORYPU